MAEPKDNRTKIVLGNILSAMEKVKDLPSQTQDITDLTNLLNDISQMLQYTVLPEESTIDEPDKAVIENLRNNGVQIDDDGILEEFSGISQVPYLQFISKLMNALYLLNSFINLKGVEKIKSGEAGAVHEKDELRLDLITFTIDYVNAFFDLLKFIYERFQFIDGTSSQLAITKINAQIFLGMDSIIAKWFGSGMSEFSNTVKRGIEATFSAYIALQGLFPNAEVRNATKEEDKKGIDFVLYQDGKPFMYVQCKTKFSKNLDDQAYEWYRGRSQADLGSLESYIVHNYASDDLDESRYDKMIVNAKSLADTAQKDGVSWGWLFVLPNYFMIKK